MNRQITITVTAILVIAIVAISYVSMMQLAKATAGTRTVYLGQYINKDWSTEYYFCGVCTTSSGTHVMTVGYNYRSSSGAVFDMFIEVTPGQRVYFGNQWITINDFTTDSLTITTES